ncbi:LysR family transcriptional regulator [Synechococcus sp. PCC 6312]|uniref:LysR family transcriptional regulator n=1 Tax=Synechococcus sp. (strain ATCC 27167 / PCC 6312) TaxID=195253 RepID=UPI00059E6E6A|nr:LysR family transcriptional regulator [Synechococcus sp. PCC 6312]
MRLEQLQAFLEVAERGSFQQAALECGVNQSTISRQIQALETELATCLFHRSAQAKLTVSGTMFLKRARKIWQEWQTANQELSEFHQGKQTELCVAAIHSVCATVLPPLLPQFCQHYPQVQLRVTALGSDRALKVLRDGLVDVAIVMSHRNLAQTAELVVHPLYHEPIGLLMAANHPLVEKTTITWEQIAAYPHVVFKDGYGMRRLVEDEFSRQNTPLIAALELNTPDAFNAVVSSSQMLALLPESMLGDAAKNPELVVRYFNKKNSSDGIDLQREVTVVTTVDRLKIPPIADFFHLITKKLAITPQLLAV